MLDSTEVASERRIMARPISQEAREQLITLCTAGRTLREAAAAVGVSENTASKYLRRAGVDVGDGRFPPALAGKDLTQLIAAYNTGATLEEAGKPFNLSVSTVRGILLRAGIKTRSSLEAARQQIAAPELLPPGRAMTTSEYGLRRNRRLRQEVVRAYGGVCECCREASWEFLTLDHICGGGKQHRASFGEGAHFYHALRKQGWPRENLRLLCYNCNLGRSRCGGVCPHQQLPIIPYPPPFSATDPKVWRRAWEKWYRHTERQDCFDAYGGRCACCGEANLFLLTIDHTHGDGAEARRAGERRSNKLYRHLRKLDYPRDRYRCLCFNCNCSRGHLGYCPHERPA